jgi:hypothetical protein
MLKMASATDYITARVLVKRKNRPRPTGFPPRENEKNRGPAKTDNVLDRCTSAAPSPSQQA